MSQDTLAPMTLDQFVEALRKSAPKYRWEFGRFEPLLIVGQRIAPKYRWWSRVWSLIVGQKPKQVEAFCPLTAVIAERTGRSSSLLDADIKAGCLGLTRQDSKLIYDAATSPGVGEVKYMRSRLLDALGMHERRW